MAVKNVPKTSGLKKSQKRTKLGGGDGGLLTKKIQDLKKNEKH